MSQSFEQILQTLHQRAAREPEFRRLLLDSPKAALRQLGVELPAELEVEVLEETQNKAYVVLPAAASGELSDDELAAAAGGLWSLSAFRPRLRSGGGYEFSFTESSFTT